MQLIEPDGRIYSGAAATFRLLSYAPGRGAWWWLYRHVPGFAPLSEAAYRFISKRRGLLAGATHLLWGRTLEPARYDLVAWLFLRGLGLIYLAAFVSLALQVRGTGRQRRHPAARANISPPRTPAGAPTPTGACRRCSG